MKKRHLKVTLAIAAFALITISAFFLAESINEDESIRRFVQQLGIFGVVLVGVVGGLNAFVPIPPATFAPLFLEADMSYLLIIGGFTLGTTFADSLSYLLGWVGSSYATTNHPDIAEKFQKFMEEHQSYIPFIIFGYFVLAPLPNEVILIPLAIIGYKYKKLIIPLIIGNVLHHTIMVFGYSTIFSWIF